MLNQPAETWSVNESTQRPAKRTLRLADLYAWVALVAILDILVTSVVLKMGGSELNPVAEFFLQYAGVPGMILLKFGCLLLVLLVIEVVSVRRLRLARGLAIFWLVTWSFPPIYGAIQIWIAQA